MSGGGSLLSASGPEGDNLAGRVIPLVGERSHVRERLKEEAGAVGPADTASSACDDEMIVNKLPSWGFLNQHRRDSFSHTPTPSPKPRAAIEPGFRNGVNRSTGINLCMISVA